MQTATTLPSSFKGLNHSLLTPDQEYQLGKSTMFGSPTAREKLILHNIRLVRSIASKYNGQGIPFEDLMQSGICGLIDGVDRFDPDKGRLSTYASRWIHSRISILFDKMRSDRPVKLPMHLSRMLRKITRIETKLCQENQEWPSTQVLSQDKEFQELAMSVNKDPSDLLKLRNIDKTIYLDEEIDQQDESGSTRTRADVVFSLDHITKVSSPEKKVADKDLVQHLLEALSERERLIISMYYGLTEDSRPMTLAEIAPLFGVGEQRIQQIHQKALSILRDKITMSSELSGNLLDNLLTEI